jgi:hypothetical protein
VDLYGAQVRAMHSDMRFDWLLPELQQLIPSQDSHVSMSKLR